jgi:hypothetical protein
MVLVHNTNVMGFIPCICLWMNCSMWKAKFKRPLLHQSKKSIFKINIKKMFHEIITINHFHPRNFHKDHIKSRQINIQSSCYSLIKVMNIKKNNKHMK